LGINALPSGCSPDFTIPVTQNCWLRRLSIFLTTDKPDELKTAVKADIVTLREDMTRGFQDVHQSFQDVHRGFQDAYKFMVVSTLTIAGTIIGTAIALVRDPAP
jgi:hypothetical protein